jgi:hypothetical protein
MISAAKSADIIWLCYQYNCSIPVKVRGNLVQSEAGVVNRMFAISTEKQLAWQAEGAQLNRMVLALVVWYMQRMHMLKRFVTNEANSTTSKAKSIVVMVNSVKFVALPSAVVANVLDARRAYNVQTRQHLSGFAERIVAHGARGL